MKPLLREHTTMLGTLVLGAAGGKLCLAEWKHTLRPGQAMRRIERAVIEPAEFWADSYVLDQAVRQLDEYFSGTRTKFDIPLLFCGTDFQRSVWETLTHIPYGVWLSYSTFAEISGHPGSCRAVAGAVASNPISIIVPCHRIIGRNLKLTGYAGTIPVKKSLLELEDTYHRCSLKY